MIIEINPLDTLFFRDGKPFTMGEENWSDAIFPPMPSVIYGALRSVYFSNHIDELRNANESADPTKDLELKGVLLKSGNELLFPAPLDCVKGKDSKYDKLTLLSLSQIEESDMVSNYPRLEKIPTYKVSDSKVENISNAMLGRISFKEYLFGTKRDFSYIKIDNFIQSEPHIGIGRSSDTHTTEEGKLYRIDMKRLKDTSIIVDFENLELPENGLLKLGGESKSAHFRVYEDKENKPFIEPPNFENEEKLFKLVLTTPAIFKNGWLPEWIDENSMEGIPNSTNLKLKLISAIIGKPVYIGGYNIKERKPKPMYKAVPAGSVYYFKLIEGTMEQVKEILNYRTISDIYPNQGFGICYLGKGEV